MSFSPFGTRILAFGNDEDHSFALYDWKNGNLITSSKVDKGKVHFQTIKLILLIISKNYYLNHFKLKF